MQFQFRAVFQRAIEAAGWQHEHFVSHSFQIGVASFVAVAGLEQEVVEALSLWRSRVFASYVRPLPEGQARGVTHS